MKHVLIAAFLLAGAVLSPLSASAATIKAFVSAFTMTPQESAGLKETLQRLLASRIAGDGISTVESPSEADLIVNPSYTQIGKMFSLDAVAKLPSGRTVASVFEQGEGQDDLIPALGRLSARLKAEALRQYQAPAAVVAPGAPAAAAPAAPQPARSAQSQPAPQLQQAEPGTTLWMSQRIDGAQTSIAPAGNVGGMRLVFISDGHKIKVYRQERKLTLVSETEIPQRGKILAVDSTGRDSGGAVLVYVTIIDGDSPSSRVYSFERGKLKLVAEKLPYMFRSVALSGGPDRIYAQEMGRVDDFYGDVYEVAGVNGGKVELKNPIKLPRYANIFNFNTFKDAAGQTYFTAFSSDRYLVVFSDNGEELWRSPEKFGGSETYFQRDVESSARPGEEKLRWQFIDQRITVTGKGEILVPQNDGFMVFGNHRSFNKYSFSSLTWNGSSLEERWKTKTTPNYAADYFYVPETGEIVVLEVVQKEGAFAKGGSAVRVVKGN